MPQIKRQKIVPYSQEAMFDLVNDVSAYHEFVPWCVKSEVLAQDEDEIKGALTFSKGAMSKQFITLNRLEPHKMIEICLVDGPFKQLEGFWRFEVYKDSYCRLTLDLAFEFSSKMLGLLFGPVFNQVANLLADVFCERAVKVYDQSD